MFKYAQIDQNNVVIGLSDLSGHVDLPNMILLDEESPNMGDKYEDGKFIKEQTDND